MKPDEELAARAAAFVADLTKKSTREETDLLLRIADLDRQLEAIEANGGRAIKPNPKDSAFASYRRGRKEALKIREILVEELERVRTMAMEEARRRWGKAA